MHGLSLTTNIMKKPNVTQILVDEEMIIMEATNQIYFSLNVIGAKIWSLFKSEPKTIIDIAQYLQKEYDLEEQQSIQDAQQFVELLLVNNLVSSHEMITES